MYYYRAPDGHGGITFLFLFLTIFKGVHLFIKLLLCSFPIALQLSICEETQNDCKGRKVVVMECSWNKQSLNKYEMCLGPQHIIQWDVCCYVVSSPR